MDGNPGAVPNFHRCLCSQIVYIVLPACLGEKVAEWCRGSATEYDLSCMTKYKIRNTENTAADNLFLQTI